MSKTLCCYFRIHLTLTLLLFTGLLSVCTNLNAASSSAPRPQAVESTAKPQPTITPHHAQAAASVRLEVRDESVIVRERSFTTNSNKSASETSNEGAGLRDKLAQKLRRVFSFNFARKGHKRNPDLLAVLSLSFGVVGFVVPFLGFLFAVAALILGIMALRRGQRRGFAIAGIVLGGFVTLFYLAYVGTFVVLILLFW